MPLSKVNSSASLWLARSGAAAYVVWALLHFHAAWLIYQLGQSMTEGMAQGRVFQGAWNLLGLSIIALITALTWNWRNDIRGWWINLVIISMVDLGFIFYVLIPGYVPMWPGLAGPLTWVLGLTMTTLALRRTPRSR